MDGFSYDITDGILILYDIDINAITRKESIWSEMDGHLPNFRQTIQRIMERCNTYNIILDLSPFVYDNPNHSRGITILLARNAFMRIWGWLVAKKSLKNAEIVLVVKAEQAQWIIEQWNCDCFFGEPYLDEGVYVFVGIVIE